MAVTKQRLLEVQKIMGLLESIIDEKLLRGWKKIGDSVSIFSDTDHFQAIWLDGDDVMEALRERYPGWDIEVKYLEGKTELIFS
ncbi:hypothetical protein C5B42_01565 [Candidatus Cerribacteria bacterium 'Amazon FNV 2010 28 9']|uniref:DUF5678 domain-containing protein n=1 Tax=Candidatus Cerribacteria bacterium 'Amazon FNV 2010 28 9' TaxID=2081795 RepID=A0A317JQH0_9BACT|nr:MAG: hypothetical protein C5B42_01565 [Candidatus Cerribacteria bacterium 'Amazon FNV 2010 28 9']